MAGAKKDVSGPEHDMILAGDVRDWRTLCQKVRDQAERDVRSPGARIKDRLDALGINSRCREKYGRGAWETICDAASSRRLIPQAKDQLAAILWGLLDDPDLYEPSYFAQVSLKWPTDAPQRLLDCPRETWPEDTVRWFNRLVLVSCFPGIKQCRFRPMELHWRLSWQDLCDGENWSPEGPETDMRDGRVLRWYPVDPESYDVLTDLMLEAVKQTEEETSPERSGRKFATGIAPYNLILERQKRVGARPVSGENGLLFVVLADDYAEGQKTGKILPSVTFRDYVLSSQYARFRLEPTPTIAGALLSDSTAKQLSSTGEKTNVTQSTGPAVHSHDDPHSPPKDEAESMDNRKTWGEPSMVLLVQEIKNRHRDPSVPKAKRSLKAIARAVKLSSGQQRILKRDKLTKDIVRYVLNFPD